MIYCFIVYELESMSCMMGLLCMMLILWEILDWWVERV